MQLTFPAFLWALSLLAIPIVIHLFQFRRFRKLYFSDTSLLSEAIQKSKTKNQLKHWLTLFLRCLFLIGLVLAFCQPFIPAENAEAESKRTIVSVYLDNSFSMDAQNDLGRLFDQAAQDAYEVANAYPANVQLQLLSNELAPRQFRLYDLEGYLTLLDAVEVQHVTQSATNILQQQIVLAQENPDATVVAYWLSDFQQNFADSILGSVDTISNLKLRLTPYAANEVVNLSIDSAWIDGPVVTPNSDINLNFSVTNHSSREIPLSPVSVFVDNERLGTIDLSFAPLSTVDTQFVVQLSSSGFHKGQLSVEDAPISFDNTLRFTLQARNLINIVHIVRETPNPNSIAKVFETDSVFRYQLMQEGDIQQSLVQEADLVVIDDIEKISSGMQLLIDETLNRGANVLMIAGKNADAAGWNESLAQNLSVELMAFDTSQMLVESLDANHFLFKDVFESLPKNLLLPTIQGRWRIRTSPSDPTRPVLSGSGNRTILISDINPEAGNMVLLLTHYQQTSNLNRNAIFVPMLINLALNRSSSQRLYYSLNTEKVSIANSKQLSEALRLQQLGTDYQFIPQIAQSQIQLFGQLKDPGFYTLVDGDSTIAVMAFNNEQSESQFGPSQHVSLTRQLDQMGFNIQTLDQDSESMGQSIKEADLGNSLWYQVLVLALVFVFFEMLILKFTSK